jgi:hypothetical protein
MRHTAITLLLVLLLTPVARADDPPEGTRASWRHKRTPFLTTSQGPAAHRCRDALAVAGESQELVCKFAYGPWDKDLEDEDVELFVRPEGADAWRRLGAGRTRKDGQADGPRGIHALGGWLIFTIPEDHTLPPGRHDVRAVVRGDGTAAGATLWVRTPGSAVAVFDIDATLTTSDKELGKELAAAGIGEAYHPKIQPGAAAVVRARAAAGALPVYVTARPDRVSLQTRAWLLSEDLPAGPLQLQSSVAAALSRSETRKYKQRVVRDLLDRGLQVIAAYGNAVTDIDAYLGAGVPAGRIFIVGPHRGERGTTPVTDYLEHLEDLTPGAH